MNSFFILDTTWDEVSYDYVFRVHVDNPFFLRIIIIVIKAPKTSDELVLRSKLESAFLEYPKDQIDHKLKDLPTALNHHFGENVARMVSNRSTNMNAFYLKGHQATKNVTMNKIRRYEKFKK